LAYLVVFQPDARVRARLSDALSTNHRVTTANTWGGLSALVAKEVVDGCVVDGDYPTREDALAEIRRLRLRHPGLALTVYADVEDCDLELYRFGGHGVDGVVLARRPPWASTIRDAMERSLASARAGHVAAHLEGRYDPEVVRAVSWAVEHAGKVLSVSDFAAALGHSTRSLGKLFRENELPPANRVLLWGRLMLAGAYLGRDGRTVEDAAFLLGYSTANALARAMKREIGRTPTVVARRGGMTYVQSRLFPRGTTRMRRGRPMRGMAVLAAVLAGSSCAGLGRGTPPATTRQVVDAILDAPPMDQVHFGVLAEELASGRILYQRNAHRHFVPASNQKLLVTSVALSLLGAEYRWETALYATGPVVAGTLEGDLVLEGTGDPTLGEPFWTSGEHALGALADSLLAAGVRRVTGRLVVDASAWDSTTVGPTWEVDDLPFGYAATGGAFAVDRGEVRVVVHSGWPGPPGPGAAPTVTWSPVGTVDYVSTDLVTAPADSATRVRATYLPESHRLVLRGRVRAGATDTLTFAVRDPVRQAGAALSRTLVERGVELSGDWGVVWEEGLEEGRELGRGCPPGSVRRCPGAARVAGLTSPPLIDVVRAILEPSQNWMTEQLVRTLGAESGAGGSWAAGLQVVERFLVDEVHVDSLDVAPRDGSGLSSANIVTPRALVRLLRYMSASPYADAFRRALAEPGEEDSTLERRLPGFEGRVFAKTGTISNVNSLSGYLVGSDGDQIVFSILSNGSGLPSSRVRAAIDDVLKALAEQRP
jgi:D-alanyl-D-alanine carboxypeptidase/D-alanyl-D-alanine-endopeptidase (penicillin-binding protein 4)